MEILVNGEPLQLELEQGATLGVALSRADEVLEGAGLIIVSLEVEGKDLDASALAATKDRPATEVGKVMIHVEPASAVRSKALSTFLELLSLAREAADLESDADWKGIASGTTQLEEAFSGLFAADELSLVKDFSAILARTSESAAGGSPDASIRTDLKARVEGLARIARERLDEIENPVGEMRKAAALYRAQALELSELPVLLQTGKDERAMKAVLLFIETFNKVIRVIPELRHSGLDTANLRIDGLILSEFYSSFNDILRGLSRAFEDKDAVQIGDLVEYEVAPRMESFFTAIEGAIERI